MFLASPIPVIQLDLDSQHLQGDAGIAPERDLHHLFEQFIQLALQLLHNRQVIRTLSVLALQMLQILIDRQVQGGGTVRYL